jgi:hypothetical protein|tara:strand:+ start:1204 stop:1434 length:231 start_codon:yes stop_codon:yes gene_type:complete
MKLYRLQVARNMHLDIQVINDYWYQVVDSYRVPATGNGDLVRKTLRGWEVFRTLESTSPVAVLTNRSELIDLTEEE